MVKELVGRAEGMMDDVNDGAKNAMQSIGGKITDFIGGNMRKVRSLLHINEKMPEGEELRGVFLSSLNKLGCMSEFPDEAKAMSSSTGNLAQAVKKVNFVLQNNELNINCKFNFCYSQRHAQYFRTSISVLLIPYMLFAEQRKGRIGIQTSYHFCK